MDGLLHGQADLTLTEAYVAQVGIGFQSMTQCHSPGFVNVIVIYNALAKSAAVVKAIGYKIAHSHIQIHRSGGLSAKMSARATAWSALMGSAEREHAWFAVCE